MSVRPFSAAAVDRPSAPVHRRLCAALHACLPRGGFAGGARAPIVLGAMLTLGSACPARGQSAPAGSGSYANSAEYRRMLEELRRPAPSPLMVSTGRRPSADPAVHIEFHDEASSAQWSTYASSFLLDKAAGTLTITNRGSHAASTLSLSTNACPGAVSSPLPVAAALTSPGIAGPTLPGTAAPVLPFAVGPNLPGGAGPTLPGVVGPVLHGTAASASPGTAVAPLSVAAGPALPVAAGPFPPGTARPPRIRGEGNRWTVTTESPCGQQEVTLEVLTGSLARLTFSRLGGNASPMPIRVHAEGEGPWFGLGERFWQAALTSTDLDVRPQDRFGEPGHNWVYVAVPLLYSTAGLGIFADTAFDMHFRADSTGSSFDLSFANGPVPLYVFSEPSPKAVLTAYTAISGRPQMLPQWAFGPWITSLGGKGAVLDMAERIRLEAVPASALWVFDELDAKNNLGWPFWFGSYYGDPREFTDLLHGQGFKVLTYVHGYVRDRTLPYPTLDANWSHGLADHLLVMGADNQPAGPRFETVHTGNLDFTNPATVEWWQGMVTAAVREQGFDGWMEDFGEWVRDSDRFAAGDGRTLSELYPLLYHKVTTRIAQAFNPGVVSFSRSGGPGTQAISPVLWGADQSANWTRDYGLPSVVTAGITAGMSGFSNWGPDIMSAGDSRELWMRWVEFGALTPIMRDHVWSKPDHSFNIWTDAETTAFFRRYANLHSSLLPLFSKYAEEAHRTGVPVMRHTALEYPNDPFAAKAEYQYFLGPDILVAPVVQPGAGMRTLYLPKGEWISYWNGDAFHGGQTVTVPSPLGEIPMLVRAGSILPFKPEAQTARWDWSDPQLLSGSLVWRAYLSESGESTGHFALPDGTTAEMTQHNLTATITGHSPVARDYEIILRSRLEPTGIELDGKPLPLYQKGTAGSAPTQWWWTGETHVRFHAAGFVLRVAHVSQAAYTP